VTKTIRQHVFLPLENSPIAHSPIQDVALPLAFFGPLPFVLSPVLSFLRIWPCLIPVLAPFSIVLCSLPPPLYSLPLPSFYIACTRIRIQDMFLLGHPFASTVLLYRASRGDNRRVARSHISHKPQYTLRRPIILDWLRRRHT
jgi:hypothetical protein